MRERAKIFGGTFVAGPVDEEFCVEATLPLDGGSGWVKARSVLIADDQALVRGGFRSILSTQPDIEVVADVADGATAVRATLQHRPDVVLMDIRMPILDGLAATRQVVERSQARVLILTTFDPDEYVYAALKAGATGFILKDGPAEGLGDAVRTVAAGQSLLAPESPAGSSRNTSAAPLPEHPAILRCAS